MAEFGSCMREEMKPEWAVFYISYETLRSAGESLIESEPDLIQRELNYLQVVEVEVERAGGFFHQQLGALAEELASLRADALEHYSAHSVFSDTASNTSLMSESSHTELTTRYRAWYSTALRLSRFAELNREAVRVATKEFIEKLPNAHSMSLARLALECVDRSPLRIQTEDLRERFAEARGQFSRLVAIDAKETLKDREILTAATSWSPRTHWILISFCLALTFQMITPLPGLPPSAHRCLSLLVLIVALWVSEAIPYFCTAMLIPVLAVPLNIIRGPDHQLASPHEAAAVLLPHLMEGVQLSVLGALVLAKGLDKIQFERFLSEQLHRFTANKPSLFLLLLMILACFLCMFISNVATPVLLLSVIRTTLWRIPNPSQGVAARSILIGLAISCNFGGMLSPIASPQNAVAFQLLGSSVTFTRWVLLTLPFALLGIVSSWAFLLLWYKPFKSLSHLPLIVPSTSLHGDQKGAGAPISTHSEEPQAMLPASRSRPSVSSHHKLLVLSTFALVTLLLILPNSPFGTSAIVALLPIVLFFGSGTLVKDDFNALPWHLIFLLSGGNLLAFIAKSSGLFAYITSNLGHILTDHPYLSLPLIIFGMAILSIFVSSAVSAMVVLPIIASLPAPSEHIVLTRIMAATLMCSGAMALPFSSFPNLNSFMAEDRHGNPYLHGGDWILPGTVATTLAALSLLIGFGPWASLVN